MGVMDDHSQGESDPPDYRLYVGDNSNVRPHNGGGDRPQLQPRPSSLSDSKEEVQKKLGRVLILPNDKGGGAKRVPVVTLNSSDTSNLYSHIERHLRGEYLSGSEKYWKVVRADQNLETWRPRVHGTQLKALLNCRLPELEDEFAAVEEVVESIKYALRPESSPQRFTSELRTFVAGVEVWWDNRNSRRPLPETFSQGSSLKRPSAALGSGASMLPGPKGQLSSPQLAITMQSPMQQMSTQHLQQQMQQPSQQMQQRQQQPLSPTTKKMSNAGSRGFDVLGGTQGLYHQGGGLMPFPVAPFTDTGMGCVKESPEDLGYVPVGVDFTMNGMLQGQGTAGPSGSLPAPLPGPHDPRALVYLNVGGKTYTSTVGTLLCVPGTYFWEVLGEGAGSGRSGHPPGPLETGAALRTHNGELFIDRNPQLFPYILEYLRAVNSNEHFSPLPHNSPELAALAREAQFYGLQGLLDRINTTAIMPEPNTRAIYDSLYLETGFSSIEGPNIKEMEQRKVVVMQQMNHVLAQKSMDGFFVAACDCGVNHRDYQDGTQHNLYYHILLKKVVPIPLAKNNQTPPQQMPGGGGMSQMHSGMGMQGGNAMQIPVPLPLPVPRHGGS